MISGLCSYQSDIMSTNSVIDIFPLIDWSGLLPLLVAPPGFFLLTWLWLMPLSLTPSLLLLYILATIVIMSVRVPTWDRAHSWWLYSTAPLGDQATIIMIWYPTQLHYPDSEPTSPWPTLIMPSVWLGQVYIFKSLVWLGQCSNPLSPNLPISQNAIHVHVHIRIWMYLYI